MSENEKNLYDLYRLIGAGTCALLTERDDYWAVAGNGNRWPQMIFDINIEKNAGQQLVEIYSDAAKSIGTQLAVCNRKIFTAADQEILRDKNIYPLETWPLMEVNPDGIRIKEKKNNCEIKKLIHPAEIFSFASMVNSDLLTDLKVNSELFTELAADPGIEFYGLFIENNLVSGLLSFTDENKIAGLYFIVTRREFRGIGLAACAIESVVQILFKQGIKKVVLQAMPKAVNLYSRLGFLSSGKLVIFWKHQHEPTRNTEKNT